MTPAETPTECEACAGRRPALKWELIRPQEYDDSIADHHGIIATKDARIRELEESLKQSRKLLVGYEHKGWKPDPECDCWSCSSRAALARPKLDTKRGGYEAPDRKADH